MEINVIFAESLYSFKYDDLFNSEYDKKLFKWQDFDYIYNKGVENKVDITEIDQFFDEIFFDREFLINKIENCVSDNTLFDIFKSLNNYTTQIIKFEESKGKIYINEKKRLSRLRIYALRVSNSCFIVTGGAIKFSLKMDEHPDTLKELNQISNCRKFLLDNDFIEDDIVDNLFESNL